METDYESDESYSSDSFSVDFSSEDDLDDLDEIEESYDPEGIESDDDERGCCHWSSHNQNSSNTIERDESVPEFGLPQIHFEENTKPHVIVEMIMDNTFIETCIDATNEHGLSDQKYAKKIGEIPKNEKGVHFLRGFFAIKWHLRLLKYPQMKWAWSEDQLKSQPEIKKIMPLDVFCLLLKHFRVVRKSGLPSKNSPNYHPLQNINDGVEYLRAKSLSLWKMGFKLCIDEGRVRSKSNRNPFKIRNPDKPIRMGWTICKLSDRGKYGGNFVANHVVKCGSKTYKKAANGKNYDIIEQLIENFKNEGRLVVMDSGFPTTKLMEDAKEIWGTRLIATQRGNTAHLPKTHKENIKAAKSFARGFSKTLSNGQLTLTYWNDNNVVIFLDNDISSGREFWDTLEVKQGAVNQVIHMPEVAKLYREIYGWVDRSNQQLAYYSTECRSVRKQNRVFDNLAEMYILANGHTIWRNSCNIAERMSKDAISQSSFRFEVIRDWYAVFKMTNGTMAVLHYPNYKPRSNKRKLAQTITSPRKGHHSIDRITPDESTGSKRRLRCRICKKKTSYKCAKCSSPGDPLALCCIDTGRDCWNTYHLAREYDIDSSQSQPTSQ
eukprot:gene4046-20219_t